MDEFKPTSRRYQGRFAPSPTGPLHLGSLMVAFGSWLLARHAGGEWLVRIEDVDRPREVSGAMTRQLATLAACGLESDSAIVRQSTRVDLYQHALQQLIDTGHAFACSCSRNDLAPSAGIHRACATSSGAREERHGYRFRIADGTSLEFPDQLQGSFRQDVAMDVGDFILRRSDGLWAYQLAVVVDDAEQGVTAVVRGADLLDSTPRQMLLQRALGVPAPAYLHLPLLVDSTGAKLSKSLGAAAVQADDPLPALRLAWSALGQEARVLGGAMTAGTAVRLAASQFDPARLPPIPQLAVAALHNGKNATDV